MAVTAAAVWAVLQPFVVAGATTYATVKVEKYAQKQAEKEPNMRERKWERLSREERKARRQAGQAWWQKSARQKRQAERQARRQAGEAWWQVAGDSDMLPPNLGSKLPGPGDPGARGSVEGQGAAAINPLVLVAVAGGALWFLTRKK